MIQIPEKYSNKIILSFGQEGKKWLSDALEIIEKYKNIFLIDNLEFFPKLSVNLLLTGYSNKLNKNILLKICKMRQSIISEVTMLKKYENFACKCLYYNETDAIMILERLYPGFTLNTLPKIEDRVKIFANIMKKTILEIDDSNNYNSYSNRINHHFSYALENKEKCGKTAELIPIAYKFYEEIQNLGLKKFLLHGDLNHKNIIKTLDDWKVIDPQGLIGEAVFEVVKFIRGEIEEANNIELSIKNSIENLSKETSFTPALISKATFINLLVVNCWRIEENHNNLNIIKNIEISEKLLEYLYTINASH